MQIAGAEWVPVLAWCPEVVDAVRYRSQDGRTIATAYKVTVGDQTEVVSAGDVVRGIAWPRFYLAYGFSGRQIADVLVNIVTGQASTLPDIPGYPYFDAGGRLRLPPTEYLPDGYTNGEGSTVAALRSLVAAVAPYPLPALMMGLSAVAPWIGVLDMQPFTLHVVGDSTVGKSTGLYAAAALWGIAYRRVAPPWAGTKIGIPGSFRDLGVLPAFRDELGTAGLTPADRATLFTNIMEGCRRIARTREDLPRPGASWASACLSTGNISAVPASHASAGTPKGVIEIHADTHRPVIPPEAKAKVRKATNAPDVAGAWVPIAMKLPLEGVRKEIERADRELGGPDSGGLAWHTCRAMSLAVTGARILAKVTGVPELAASAELAARQVIADVEDRLAEIGADHGARLVDTVTEFLSIRPAAFGEGDPRNQAHTDQVGFLAATRDGTELVCIYPAKHAEIARAAEVEDVTAALRQCRESGQLMTSPGQGLKYRTRRDGRLVSVIAYKLGAETSQNNQNNQNTAGQGPNSCSDQGQERSEHKSEHGDKTAGSAPLWGPDTVGAQINREPLPEPPLDYDPDPDSEPPVAVPGALTVILAGKAVPAVRCPGCRELGPASIAVDGYHINCEPEPPAAPEASEPPAADPLPGLAPEPEPDPDPVAAVVEDQDHAPDPVVVVAEDQDHDRVRRPVADLDPAAELAAFARSIRKIDADATDDDCAAALAVFHEVSGGVRWVSYEGQVGQAWFARLAAQHPSMKAPAPLEWPSMREVTESGPLTRINYVAKPGKPVRAGKYHVTSYDLNGQHLAAASSAELGDGEPDVIENPRSIEGLTAFPGYVRLGRAFRTGHPAFGTRPAGEWIAMPLVRFLVRDLGLAVPAAEVVYWPRKGRRLSVYAARCRDARERLMNAEQTGPVRLALAALKSQANAFVGMFHSETYSHGGFYRPDWYDMVVSQAEANALRALAKCPVLPVAKMADSAYWIADEAPYVPAGLTISGQLGKWKLDRYGPVTDDLITAIKASPGSPGAVRDAVIQIDAERRPV